MMTMMLTDHDDDDDDDDHDACTLDVVNYNGNDHGADG